MREELTLPQTAAPPLCRVLDAFRKRPLVSAAALYAAGIFAHGYLPIRPLLYLPPVPVLLLLFLLPAQWIKNTSLSVAIFLAGLAAAQLDAFHYPSDHIAHFACDEPRLAHAILRIDTPPRTLRQSGPIRLPPRIVCQATVLELETTTGWIPATGRTLLQINESDSRLQLGQRIILRGMLLRPRPAENPGQYDWADYYRQQRILTSLNIPHAANVSILDSPGPGALGWLRAQVRESLAAGFDEAQSLDHALLRALVVGDSDPQLRDIQDQFIRTGTSHHLTISGMHIAVLGAVVWFICRLLLVHPRFATWIALIFVILYGLIALPSPPVVRSVLLCVAFGLGILGRRSADGIQLLSLSVLAMLIYKPLDLYDPGFQLSFATVLGLMALSRPTVAYFESLRDRDVVIALQAQPPRGLHAAREWLRRKTLEIAVAGGVAWLVASPLVAFHFTHLNPWAILASLLLAVPVFAALVAGMLKIILSILIPPAAPLLASVAALPIRSMRLFVDLLDRLPGSNMPIPRPGVWFLVLYYSILILPLVPLPRLRWRGLVRLAPVACVLLLIGLPVANALRLGSSAGEVRITLLSVGAGQCAAVHLPDGKMILIDAGSDSMSDVARYSILPYLQEASSFRVDRAFISHANQDHFNGLPAIVRQCGLRQVHVDPFFASHVQTSAPGRDLLRTFSDEQIDPRPLAAGDRITLAEGLTLDVLWPPRQADLDINDSSLVLRLTYGDRSILFTGDIERSAQGELLRRPDQLKSDVLIAPHHGSSEESTADFVAAVDPHIVVCSSGRRLTGKQRRFDELAAMRTLYRTSSSGAITITFSRSGNVDIQGFRATHRPNR